MTATHQSGRNPRVLHCVSHLALGGAERVALTIIAALRPEYDFGVYAVRGVSDGEMGESLRSELRRAQTPSFTGPRVAMKWGGMLTGAVAMSRAINRFQPDLIHLHTEIPEASYAALVALRPGIRRLPLVRTIHNSVYWEFYRPLGRWCDHRMTHGYCAGVSADAVAAMQRLRAESGAGALPLPSPVIYNAVVENTALPPGSRSASEPLQVVFGGRLEAEKGADLLPEILARTRAPEKRGAKLTIFGSGRYAPLLHALAARPPAGWSVELRPPAPDFRTHLAGCDFALVPSRYEGLGLVAIEALVAGVPVVTTAAPGLREVVPPGYPWIGRAGDAASIAAALQTALDANADQRANVIATGRAFARTRFSLPAFAEGYRTLYRQALGQSSSVAGNLEIAR